MKSPNKIRERDMDSEFLLSLKSGIDSAEASKILADYIRKDESINMTQIPAEYTEYVKALIANSGGGSGITTVTEDSLDDNLKSILTRVKELLTNPTQPGSGGSSEEIAALRQTIDEQQNQINSLNTQLESLRTQMLNYGSDVSLQNKIDQAIDEALAKVESGVESYGNRLVSVENDIKQIKNTFNNKVAIQMSDLNADLQEKINSISSYDIRISSLAENSVIKGQVNPGQWLRYSNNTNGVVTSAEMVIRAAVCHNEEEFEAEKLKKTEKIITSYDSKLYTCYGEDDDYDEAPMNTDTYNDRFVYDTRSEMLVYVIQNGNLIKMSNNSLMVRRIGVEIKLIELGPGEHVEVVRDGNFDKLPVVVQVKDTAEGSRTFGQYINSEGIITVVNESESFTVYNDSDTETQVKVLIPNFIKSTDTSTSSSEYDEIKSELKEYIDAYIASGVQADVDLTSIEDRLTAVETELRDGLILRVGDV